jgi:uncharacterized membrane protein
MELVSRVSGAVMHFVAWLESTYISRENVVSIFMIKEKAKQETRKKLVQSKNSLDYLLGILFG